MGCGGSSSQNGFVTEVTDSEISLSAADIDVTLPRDLERDEDALFAVARETDEDGPERIVAVSESAATRAAIFIIHDDVSSADPFYDRKTALNLPMRGRATFEGAYFGTFVGPEAENLRARIDGTASFAVEFETLAVSGFIDERTSPLFGLVGSNGTPFAFDLSTSLLLETADIQPNGRFSGNITVIDSNGGEDGNGSIIPNFGTYSGTFGGADASEIVGEIAVKAPRADEDGEIDSVSFAPSAQTIDAKGPPSWAALCHPIRRVWLKRPVRLLLCLRLSQMLLAR